jgi:hypothetical protein
MSGMTRYLLTSPISDILSFYKEELVGEKDNYIHSRARVTNQLPHVVVKDVADEIELLIADTRSILKGEKEKQTWEIFMKGYIAFHYITPRYKLLELLDGEDVLS